MGNMVSSAAAQIEATSGKTLRTTLNGKSIPDYAKIQAILYVPSFLQFESRRIGRE